MVTMIEPQNEAITAKSIIRAGDLIDWFGSEIRASVNTEPTSTGFEYLDYALGGGLFEGLYAIGAVSSLGKTTFVLQMADYIGEKGTDVLIFSLEMSKFELMAKSISRNTCILSMDGLEINTKLSKTNREITQGNKYKGYSKEQKDHIVKAVAEYKKAAQNIYICEGVGDISVKDICRITKEHCDNTGRSPVVIVDYLQILAPYSERATDKQNTDKSIVELKRLSRDLKIPVLAISSMNRASYNNRQQVDNDNTVWDSEMTGFKESGGIEYSCDVLIKLKANNDKSEDIRDISLLILKNRHGDVSNHLKYSFHKHYSYFSENFTTRR